MFGLKFAFVAISANVFSKPFPLNLRTSAFGFTFTSGIVFVTFGKVFVILSTGKLEGYIRKEINEEIRTRLRIEMIESGFNQDIFPLNRFDFREIQYVSFDLFIRGIVTKEGLLMYDTIIKKMK